MDNYEVYLKLKKFIKKKFKIMSAHYEELSNKVNALEANNAELISQNAEIKANTENIKQDITRIKEGLPQTGGLSEDEVIALKGKIDAVVEASNQAKAAFQETVSETKTLADENKAPGEGEPPVVEPETPPVVEPPVVDPLQPNASGLESQG